MVQLSKWKCQLLENTASRFEPIDKQTDASQQRITNYVSVLMDVFTGMVRGWQLSRHLTQSLIEGVLGRTVMRKTYPYS